MRVPLPAAMMTTLRPMRTPLSKRGIIAIAWVAAALLAAGCSMVRMAYNQAPELAYWWLDGYVDFSDAQAPKAREAVSSWFAWHRKTELPEYAALLDRAQADVQRDTTPAQICEWSEVLKQRFHAAGEQALPAMADLAITLDEDQLKHMKKRFEKTMKDFSSDYLQPKPEEREKASVKRVVERMETVYGPLDERQKRLVASGVAESPFDAAVWGAERRARQDDVLQTLRKLRSEHADADQAQAAIRTLMRRLEESPDPAYRAYQVRLVQYNCSFAAQVHNAMTEKQRDAAARRLKGWAEDARSLASQPEPR